MRTALATVGGVLVVLLVAGCGASHPDRGAPTPTPSGAGTGGGPPAVTPGPDPSALVRSLGQGCTWMHGRCHGLTVRVASVRRNDTAAGGAGQVGCTVAVHLTNGTPLGYAAAGLSVSLWVGPHDTPAASDPGAGLGAGLPDTVVAPGGSADGAYGFAVPAADAGSAVAVGVRPSLVDQPCLFRGTILPP